MSTVRIVLSTADSEASAKTLARSILDARLAACVNLVPNVESHYWWQGSLECSAEVLMIIKTTQDCIADLKTFVAKHHTYDTPELIVLSAADGLERYMAWVEKETRR